MSDSPTVIYIAPLGNVTREATAPIEARVHEVFALPVELYKPRFDPKFAFDTNRKQYNSTKLLLALHHDIDTDDAKIIGITSVDLFIPVLTFVFGEAALGGRSAVASSFRLHNEFYGLPEDEELLYTRLQKEVNHELGHTFGLVHCENPACVMYSSTAVEEIDIKKSDLCGVCRRAIGLAPAL